MLLQVYYGFITNATEWQLVTLRRVPDSKRKGQFLLRYKVSTEYTLLFKGMKKDDKDQAKKWKAKCSPTVNAIYTIISRRLSKLG